MSELFSTDLVPVSDRLEAWRWNAKQICGDCRFFFPKNFAFHGSIEARRVAGLEFTLFSSSALSFQKFPLVSLHSEKRACIVITQLAGIRSYCQGGKMAVLKRGDTTLIDSGRPWSSDCRGDCARLYLRIPYALMERRLRRSTLPMARRISGVSGLGTILYSLSTSLFREALELTSEEGAAAVEAYLRILSECVGESEGLPGARKDEEVLPRVATYIENHLTETNLGPARIAAEMGVSVRHLHRLFSSSGCTIAGWIRNHRLDQCRRELSDPSWGDRSITEIAFFWGFNDSAHFSRLFKERFGVCPRAFRSRSRSDAPTGNAPTCGRELLLSPSTRYLRPS